MRDKPLNRRVTIGAGLCRRGDVANDDVTEAVQRLGVQFEEFLSGYKAERELLVQMSKHVEHIPAMREDIAAVKAEQAVHRQILTEHSADLHEIKEMLSGHDGRIARLEAASR